LKLLLDTQVWLWSLVSLQRLTPPVAKLLGKSDNSIFLSAASCWEIAIKYQLGKLSLPEAPEQFIAPRLLRDGIQALPVNIQHATRVAGLAPVHRDPFDRLLVAQAQIENLTLVSADPVFARYEIDLISC
jgi:PIN domain nuclease of toxin-antitoxin system